MRNDKPEQVPFNRNISNTDLPIWRQSFNILYKSLPREKFKIRHCVFASVKFNFKLFQRPSTEI